MGYARLLIIAKTSTNGGLIMHFERKGEWMQLAIPDKWKNMSIEDLFRTVMLASKKQVHLFKMQKK